jgi:hypothetical protein
MVTFLVASRGAADFEFYGGGKVVLRQCAVGELMLP